MSANHVLLQRLEVSNSTSTVVSFRNIPQTGYTDLKIVVSGRTVRSGTDRSNDFLLTFNDNASGYSRKDLGDSAVRSTGGSSLSNIGRIQMPSDDATANTFGNAEIYIANYTSSQNKAVTIDNVSQDNNTYGPTWLVAGLWSNSSPISSISLTADQSGTITAGSTFSLYGIAKLGTAPQIAPKAFGGDIIANDGEYWYHAFLTTGAFKPITNMSCDYLVIAGGGGGGPQVGGGGGAGGLRVNSSVFLSPASYTVTVGSGGAGAGAYSITGYSGGTSSFNSFAASGGGGGGYHASVASNGVAGGSGGGGGGGNSGSPTGGAGNAGSYSPVEGYAGGAGTGGGTYSAGGGGGAGGVGSAGSGSTGGAGGVGSNTYSAWSYATNTGVAGYYAGGGGGCSNTGSVGGLGGLGGGGNGSAASSAGGTSGVANTGGGGGGYRDGNGGNGGSGIVIVRYAMA